MYSQEYVPGDKITPALTRRVLRAEILDVAKECAYCGIWQLLAVASVLVCPVMSVCPEKGNPPVRAHLNRLILPRVQDSNVQTVYVMWTSTRNLDMEVRNWIPNHFVPMMPISAVQPTLSVETTPEPVRQSCQEIMDIFDSEDMTATLVVNEDSDTDTQLVSLADVMCRNLDIMDTNVGMSDRENLESIGAAELQSSSAT